MPVVDENGDYFIPVTDTMIDMICHTCGSVVFIVHYTVHTLTKKSLFLDALKKDFSSGKKESPVQAELSPDAHTEE